MEEIFPSIETIYDILLKLEFPNNVNKLTKKEISEIIKTYEFKNNTEILEFIDVLIVDGYEKTLNNLKDNKFDFYTNSSLFNDFKKEKLLENLNNYKKKIKYEREYNCPRCDSNNIEEREAQTRAADEGTTLFRICQDCGKSF